MPQQWEYVTVPLIVHSTKQILDQWGEDGWELVQVVTGPQGAGLVAYLKRPKP
jgi:pantothenate kinase-related protein Tda10